MFRRWLPPRPTRSAPVAAVPTRQVLVLGPSSAGKTVLVRQLERAAGTVSSAAASRDPPQPVSLRTVPTTGTSVAELSPRGPGCPVLHVREVGSGLQLRWGRWIDKSDLVVFVVDAADADNAATAFVGLMDVLGQATSVPVLVVLNKCEACSPAELSDVCALLRVGELLADVPNLSVLQASAATGARVDVLLDRVGALLHVGNNEGSADAP